MILTHTEAAKFINDSQTLEYKRECLQFWRKIHGNDYADKVKSEYLKIVKIVKK